MFVITLIVFAIAGYAGFRVASSADEQYGETRFTKNQIRAFAWLLVVVIALLGAIIEYRVITSGGHTRNYQIVPVDRPLRNDGGS